MRLLAGHKESCDVPPQVMRDLGCLRFSDQRTLLHAALGRKDGTFPKSDSQIGAR